MRRSPSRDRHSRRRSPSPDEYYRRRRRGSRDRDDLHRDNRSDRRCSRSRTHSRSREDDSRRPSPPRQHTARPPAPRREWDEGKTEFASSAGSQPSFFEQRKKSRESAPLTLEILRQLWAGTPDILAGLKSDEPLSESDEEAGKPDKRKKHRKHKRRHRSRSNESVSDGGKERSRSRHKHKRRHRHHRRRRSSSSTGSKNSTAIRRDDSSRNKRKLEPEAIPQMKAATDASEEGDEWVERKVAQQGEDIFIGPVPIGNADNLPQVKSYGKGLMRGEGEAIAAFVQSGKRIPRRGEIGLESEQIQQFEDLGYVMSGSRHHVMNMMRMRKENQVIGVEEKRQLLKFAQEERMRRENEIVAQFREIVQEKLPTDLQELNEQQH